MDILTHLPDTRAGRHTRWLWSRMLALAGGAPLLDAAELADHFAPSVLDHVPADHLIAQFTQLAPTMALVTQVVEETSSSERYSALLGSPDLWLRYSCLAQDSAPHLLIDVAYLPALPPNTYSERRVQRDGRDVRIRDFGGTGPLMLLWHGALADLTWWETLVPHLAGFHVIAQDLPGHGRSPLKGFTTADALADADAVTAEFGEGPPIVVGQSLGGYLGLRYSATRRCSGWVGLDGPFAVVYPWERDDPGMPEFVLQIRREIRAIDVVRDFAARNCPAMLILCSVTASPIEEPMGISREELADHIVQRHSDVRIEWVQTGHDALLFHKVEETAARIRDFLQSFLTQCDAEPNANAGPAPSVDNSNAPGGPPSVS